MEKDLAPIAPVTAPDAPAPAAAQPFALNPDSTASYAPLHTQSQSTLAPTSEYVRYLLLALPARYIPRGIFGTMFEEKPFGKLSAALTAPGRWLQNKFPKTTAKNKEALAYNTIMGLGSLALTASYSSTVYSDIKNVFAEAVAFENGQSPESISWSELKKSDNRIVQKTIENFWKRTARRLVTDLVFIPAAIMRNAGMGDLMVGGKALQAFGETWKRKTTMFEDLITFVNNKINPRNGLGQAISVGEVFDLYQHYTEAFNPEKMFTNVLERGTGEGARWAQSQPIFDRLTELMNLTYAYKHSSLIDPKTGHAVHQADFALPKFIYLLGHDLIDVHQPKQTLATIEIANRFGIPAVKEMQTMLKSGNTLEQVIARFPVVLHTTTITTAKTANDGKNGVIAKGSTVQLDQADAPSTTVDANSIALAQTMSAPTADLSRA